MIYALSVQSEYEEGEMSKCINRIDRRKYEVLSALGTTAFLKTDRSSSIRHKKKRISYLVFGEAYIPNLLPATS